MLYAESSAVLAWLLGEPSGTAVEDSLRRAPKVVSSRVTLLECERSLVRGTVSGRLKHPDAEKARRLLAGVVPRWALVRVSDEVLERARGPFPKEPVRSLDAIHLGTLLLLQPAVSDLEVVSRDDRVRENAALLGIHVVGLPP